MDETTTRAVIYYRHACECGLPPTQAVATQLGISVGATAQRVFRLRAAGRLGPTTPGTEGI